MAILICYHTKQRNVIKITHNEITHGNGDTFRTSCIESLANGNRVFQISTVELTCSLDTSNKYY